MKIDITIGGKFSPIVMFLYRKFFRFKPLWVKRSVCLFFKSLKTRFICDLSRERKKISFDYCINEKKIVPLQSHCARTCART